MNRMLSSPLFFSLISDTIVRALFAKFRATRDLVVARTTLEDDLVNQPCTYLRLILLLYLSHPSSLPVRTICLLLWVMQEELMQEQWPRVPI